MVKSVGYQHFLLFLQCFITPSFSRGRLVKGPTYIKQRPALSSLKASQQFVMNVWRHIEDSFQIVIVGFMFGNMIFKAVDP